MIVLCHWVFTCGVTKSSEGFRRKCGNLIILQIPQLLGHNGGYSWSQRLTILIYQYTSVVVETNNGAVRPSKWCFSSHNNGSADIPSLDSVAGTLSCDGRWKRSSLLYHNGDLVTDSPEILRTVTKYLDTFDNLSAWVIDDVKKRLQVDHFH